MCFPYIIKRNFVAKTFNSIQVYLYSAFYDTIVAKRFTGN